ncbi:endolytic transglycosylase MltG [Streptomyces seoulensis]|uniref:endolytic transglycosylase MltG n=1 Tax=Streptomyces seoulensis TaxID=73044 RepID=UPI001FCBFEAF|nr:endolytic transglycosylase MltG [Streptomyces seoulensis]BDH04810.1 membrane protein [Streptomyces seoulensis]
MTEYGRGPGTEPWHPEDPLYGDGGWGGQQAHAGQQHPYGGQPQHPQHQQYGNWSQDQQPGYGGQQYPQYDGQGQQYFDPQQTGQHPQQTGQHPQQHQGGWDATGTHGHVPYAADPGDPYGQHPAAYGAEQPDLYGTEDAYPPPQPPGHRHPESEPEPEPEAGWDPQAEPEEHPLPAGDDDADPEADGREPRTERRGKGRKPVKSKKGRTGCALMVVVVVFGGGLGGVAYFGYQFYKNRFAPAPDYAGSGNGESVTVEIPKGAGGYDIGNKLKEAGVVESVDAFVSAQAANPKAKALQDGVYILQKHMSAASAVELMLSPKSRNNLIIAEGTRNVAVYALIDKRLKLAKGTTQTVAKKEYKSLGLPAWALNHPGLKDPLEGFLFPSSYAIGKDQKPKDVLKAMVERADEKYTALGLEQKASGLGLESPWQLLTTASLVQAEGKTHEDFRKMAEVVYNRLKPDNTETNQLLQFDSTYNYLKGASNIHISEDEINGNRSPYNTYTNKGLPPGPIGNPGDEALNAALAPTDDGWMYFVATDGMNKTEFAKTYSEFKALKDKFNAN